MEHTRVNRLLGTMRFLGLAEQTPDRKYVPGAGLSVLAAMGLRGNRLLKVALPHLERLVAEVNRGVALGVLWRTQVCYLYFGWPGMPVEVSLAGAGAWPAQDSSIGHVLLAEHPDAMTRELFSDSSGGNSADNCDGNGNNNDNDDSNDGKAVDVAALLRLLKNVRRQGYAMGLDDKSIAVPVGKPPIAGLAISGSLDKNAIPSLLPPLRATAVAIANNLERYSHPV
jgi:DNA-binding IclR family transcriptional regulator